MRPARAGPWVGGFEVVQRLDWGDTPIYVSFDDAKQGRLLGAAVSDAHVWWIECARRFDDLNWLHGLIRKIDMESEELVKLQKKLQEQHDRELLSEINHHRAKLAILEKK